MRGAILRGFDQDPWSKNDQMLIISSRRERTHKKVVGDATKARFIATFIDNILAFAVMLIAVGLMPEQFRIARGVFVFVGYLGYFFFCSL